MIQLSQKMMTHHLIEVIFMHQKSTNFVIFRVIIIRSNSYGSTSI